MTVSTYLANELLDHVFKSAAYTDPAAVYLSLHTGDPGLVGSNEVTGTGYLREVLTFGTVAASGQISNTTLITFDAVGAGGWGTVTHWGIWDDDGSPAGNFLWGGELSVSKVTTAGDVIKVQIGDLDITLT